MSATELNDERDEEIRTQSLFDNAACAGSGGATALWFSDDLSDIAIAKATCRTCSLISPCLNGALQRREPWGVWGGQLFENGAVLAQKRRRGRPSKQPRPFDEDIALTA